MAGTPVPHTILMRIINVVVVLARVLKSPAKPVAYSSRSDKKQLLNKLQRTCRCSCVNRWRRRRLDSCSRRYSRCSCRLMWHWKRETSATSRRTTAILIAYTGAVEIMCNTPSSPDAYANVTINSLSPITVQYLASTVSTVCEISVLLLLLLYNGSGEVFAPRMALFPQSCDLYIVGTTIKTSASCVGSDLNSCFLWLYVHVTSFTVTSVKFLHVVEHETWMVYRLNNYY